MDQIKIRRKLIELARQGKGMTWSYSQLNDQLPLGLDFSRKQDIGQLGEWLDEISLHEYQKERPLLSCMVKQGFGKGNYGEGFYKLYASLFGGDWEQYQGDKDWEKKLIDKCNIFWKNPDNFEMFKNDF